MRHLYLLSFALLLLLGLLCPTTASSRSRKVAKAEIKNPVIDADAPDPSVIRVGKTYYAAATSGKAVRWDVCWGRDRKPSK